MTCREHKEWLNAKENFDEDATFAAETHCDVCESCKKLSMLDSQIESQIKMGLRKVEPPTRLLARIEMNVQSNAGKMAPVSHLAWKIVVPVLALAAMFILFINPFAGSLNSVQKLGILAVESHLKDMTMTVNADKVRDISRWFETQLGFAIVMPKVAAQGLQLMGGRLCSLGKHDVAYLLYKKGEQQRVSLFIVEPDDLDFEMKATERHTLSERGCLITMWREAELVYVMVA